MRELIGKSMKLLSYLKDFLIQLYLVNKSVLSQ